MENKRADVLNVIRTSALLMVFFLHGRGGVPGLSEYSGPFAIFTKFPAWAGVWILLFISSYLLGMNFCSGKYILIEDERFSFRGLWQFYRSRLLRIVPLYYFYCFMFELLSGDQYLLNAGWTTVKILTFTFNGNGGVSGIGHLWYLSTAMQFYLLVPFVYLLVRQLRTEKVCLTVFFVSLLCGFGIRYCLNYAGVDWYNWIYTFTLANLDFLLCGLLLARISQMLHNTMIGAGKLIKCISVVAFVILVFFNCYISFYNGAIYLFLYRIVLPTIYILSCSLLIIAWKSRRDSAAVYGWGWGCINGFAKYSYAFYILHISVLSYVQSIIAKFSLSSDYIVVNYIVYFGISLAITWVMAAMMTNIGRKRKYVGKDVNNAA